MAKTENAEGGSVAVRRRRKRVSKKNKIAWRKHCSTKDVDAFLDDVRHEERVGVKFSTAKDDTLFFIDKSTIPEQIEVKTNAQKKLEAKKKLAGVPRCFQALLPQSAVPDPVIKRNKVKTPEERKDPILKRIEAARKACGILKAKERDVIRNRQLYEENKLNRPKIDDFTKDIWCESGKTVDVTWLNPTTLLHTLKNTGKTKKKVPNTILEKQSVLPAIEAPHPGMSYNPTYKDHCALLENVVDKEKKLMKDEEHLHRVTTAMFRQMPQDEHDKAWITEMTQGLGKHSGDRVKEEEDANEPDYRPVNPPTKDKKKTRKQRRNLKLAKQEEEKRKQGKIEKKKVADIYKLKKIVANMDKSELKSLERQSLQKKKKELKETEVKRLSQYKFEEPELEFNMPYDLSGNLRGLKTEGNILMDRYKSMQKRNILEPRVLQRPRNKAKKKVYTKSSHK